MGIARTIMIGVVLTAVTVTGCGGGRPTSVPPASPPSTNGDSAPAAAGDLAWLELELTDAVTGERFRLSDHRGEPVLLHAFAAW